MKNKAFDKRIITSIATVCVIAVFCFFLISCVKENDYREVFLHNWDVELPENMEKQFSKQEDNLGHYGARFATFVFESEPTEFLSDFEKESSENVGKHIEKVLSEARIKIPEKYIPDMSKDYYWKYFQRSTSEDSKYAGAIDYYIMIYFVDDMRLSIYQYFESYEAPKL